MKKLKAARCAECDGPIEDVRARIFIGGRAFHRQGHGCTVAPPSGPLTLDDMARAFERNDMTRFGRGPR